MFETAVTEQIEAYVYALIDPRTELPFYIGKGRGNRIFDHAASALEAPKATDKYDTITEIVSAGMEVGHLRALLQQCRTQLRDQVINQHPSIRASLFALANKQTGK